MITASVGALPETFNFNQTDIWKRVHNFGSTKYINILDGREQVVPWGHLDWIELIWSSILTTAVTGGLAYMVLHFFKVI